MKFLDLNGLTHFYEKIKASFVKTEGESVINMDDDNEGLRVNNVSSSSTTLVPSGFISYNINGDEQSEMVAKLQFGDLILKKIHIINGTSSQILIADGSTKTINAANGICGLDSNGNVPLSQLGNLDTTVAEVVTALPTTNIKKHIYLIKDTSGVTQNQYEEYIYTGNTSATYDASKWEKLGDFRATVDLADYAKKSEAANRVNANYAPTSIFIKFIAVDGHDLSSLELFGASSTQAGLMIARDKNKLDGIADNANNYSLPTASSTTKGGITLGYSQSGKNYPVVLDSNGKAYVNVPWIDTNTTYSLATSTKDGLMKASDKAKIDSIDTTYAKRMEVVGLDGIEIEKIPQGPFTVQSIVFPNVNKGDAVNITFEPATTTMNGFMSTNDKNKLNNIANGATADSAITTAEIDALFA